ncbi:MAG: RagB/SusD family nutrient uptake outer membrane protein [Alistipes sp.]|nr:RagB/SusD family nutrient uptake outer membrane protein [Alistipes sp.]
MKRLYMIVLSLAVASMFGSCNFLDVDRYFSDEIKIDSVFNSTRNVEAYMWGITSYFADEGSIHQNADTPGPLATDEAFTMYETLHGYNGLRLVLNEINASNLYSFETMWKNSYIAIRKCNTLFQRIDEAADMTPLDRAEIMATTRFLRAYAYYKILTVFGPPIIVGDEVIPSNEDLAAYDCTRSTYDEAVEYICSELEAAAVSLPTTRPIMEFGRPTRGAAYGLIARIRLYHASPLFNGGAVAKRCFGTWKRSSDDAYYVSQNYDESRWALAAAAAKRVMEMTNGGAPMYRLYTVEADSDTPALPEGVTSDPNYYEPWPVGAAGIDHYRSYSEGFNGEAVLATNPEFVWGRNSGTLRENTRMAFPLKAGGWSGMAVPQKIIDNYAMVDGRPIDNSSEKYPYSESGFTTQQKNFSGYRLNSGVFNMYNNREMRFYASIGFSECYWPCSSSTTSGLYNLTITYYYDSANGKLNSATDYTPTGYVIKKFIHPADAWDGTNARRMDKAFPIIRYADILLMYAEALNNLTTTHTVQLGDQTYTLSRDVQEIRNAFDQVRHRAGLPGLSDSELASAQTVQDLIVKERMIELLHENHRYFDVRRWGIYEEVESEPITGMNVDSGKAGFYTRVIPNTSRIGSRLVNKKLMFLPLPLSEIRKLPSVDQNPGWED